MTRLQSTIATPASTAALVSAGAAMADSAMAEIFAADRLALFGKGDAAGLLAQYAPDAVVVTPSGVLHGPAEIKGMIDGIVGEFARPGVGFTLISQNAVGDVVAFTWSAVTAKNRYDLGAETYVLRDGMVACQTFAALVTPR